MDEYSIKVLCAEAQMTEQQQRPSDKLKRFRVSKGPHILFRGNLCECFSTAFFGSPHHGTGEM